jgi:hypothetical protein
MVGNPKNGSLKKNSAPRIFFRPMGEINNIFNGIGTIQLTCIIRESFGFMNKHPQQSKTLCCGFRQGASHPSFDRLRTMSLSNGPKGGLFMKAKLVHE